MTIKSKISTGIVLLLVLIAATACGAETPAAEPTQDINLLRTEVAATVLAQVTVPTCPATSLPSPTPTITVINTAVLQPTAAASGTLAASSGTPAAAGTAATAAATGTPTSLGTNLAEWASQSVTDGTVFTPGESFSVTWELKNTGTTTWTPGYMLRYFAGEPFGAPKEVLINQTVLPGQTATITVPMIAPGLPGDYRSDWVMATDIRANFKQSVFIKITVQRPPTKTPKPSPTTAPTNTRQPTAAGSATPAP